MHSGNILLSFIDSCKISRTVRLTSVFIEKGIYLSFVHGCTRRLHEVLERILVKLVGRHIQSPIVLSQTVYGCVVVRARHCHEMADLGSLGLLQLVLYTGERGHLSRCITISYGRPALTMAGER